MYGRSRAEPEWQESKNCGEPDTRLERSDHYPVHFIVNNMTSCSEINGINDLVISILFISVEILGLPAVSRVMEKQRVVGLRILHQPVHGSKNICLRWLTHWILLIVR